MSAASVLDVQQNTDKKGKKYYKFELLSRTGQRHSVPTASTESWLMLDTALQLLCLQSAFRAVFSNVLLCRGSNYAQSDPAACTLPAAVEQQGDREEADHPAVCGDLCGGLPGALRTLSCFFCSRWQALRCCKGGSTLTDDALSGLQLTAMRAAGTS